MSVITSKSKEILVSGSSASRRKALLALAIAAAAGSMSLSARATVQDWIGAGDTVWTNAANWAGAIPANDDGVNGGLDQARFNQTSYANLPVLVANQAVNGIIIGDGTTNTAAMSIGGASTLTIGDAGIVMNAHAGNATISGPVTIRMSETWTNASSNTLAVTGTLTRVDSQGDGTLGMVLSTVNTGTGKITTGLLNGASGNIGNWMTYTDTTGTYYASNLTNTAGGTLGAAVGTNVTDANAITNAALNYNLSLSATNNLTANAVANTVRYTGGAEILSINGASTTLTTGGILNAGTGALTITNGPTNTSGGVVLGGTGSEMVLIAATADINMNAPVISNSATGTSLTIGGSHNVFLTNVVDNGAGRFTINGSQNSTGSVILIGPSKNITFNGGTNGGNLWVGGGDPDVDVGINETVPGSTVTLMGNVALSRTSNFTGGLILAPGANLFLNQWTGDTTDIMGRGAVVFQGNNVISKQSNTYEPGGYNNEIVLNGNITIGNLTASGAHYVGGSFSMYFLHWNVAGQGDGSQGYGEVHLGQTVSIFTSDGTDTRGTIDTGPLTDFGASFGGVFDEHGYGIIKTGPSNMTFWGSAGKGDPIDSDFTGSITVNSGSVLFRSGTVTNRDNLLVLDTAGAVGMADNPGTFAGITNGNTGPGTILTSSNLNLGGTGTYSFSGKIVDDGEGSGNLNKLGGGTQNLSGANTYSGTTSVTAGTLNLAFSAATTADVLYNGIVANSMTVGSGTLLLTGAAGGVNSQRVGSIALGGAAAITLVPNGAASLFLATGNITRNGSGSTVNFTLPSGAQSLTNGVGSTASNDATGILGGHAVVTVGANVDWATVSGATHTPAAPTYDATELTAGNFDGLDGDVDVWTGGKVFTVGQPISFNAITGTAGLPAGVTAGTLYYVTSFNNTLFGGTQTWLTFAGTPTGLPIPNSTNLNGTLSIDTQGNVVAYSSYAAFAGAGSAATANTLLTGSGSVTASETMNSLKIVTSGASQSLNVAAAQTLTLASGGLLLTGTNDYAITGGAGSALATTSTELIVQQYGTGNLTISVPFGGYALTKTGPGKLTLTAANTFSGPVYFNGGIVNINSLSTLGTGGGGAVFGNGTLQYAAGFSGTTDLSTRGITLSGGAGTIDTNGNAVTFADAIGGDGGLTKVGAGTLTLGANNTYGGPTTISGGVLSLGSGTLIENGGVMNVTVASAIGTSSLAPQNLVLDGGTLQYLGAAASTDRNFTLTQNGGTLDASGAANAALAFTNTSPIATTGSGARTLTLTGSSTGANSLALGIGDGTGGATSVVKNGAGTWLLNGASTYTGATTVNAGTLGGSGTLASTVVAGSAAHTIAPSAGLVGNTATTFTVGGLTTNANTTLAFNLLTPGASSVSDRINVTGNNKLTLSGGALAITNNNTGLASLGYYKVMQYSGSIQGTGITSVVLPAAVNHVAYVLDTAHDPGFVDVHRGLQGDANDDGLVNFADFVLLSNNFTATNKGWGGADFNGDGITNFADFVILSNNFGATIGAAEVASFGASHASGVPEPTSLALLGAGLLGVIGARRRSRGR